MPTTTRNPRRPVKAAPAHDPIPIDASVETWRNNMPGKVVITRVGEYGRHETIIVNGGRTFEITPQERRINQSAAANPDLDVFVNGTLSPVMLIDGEPDTEALRANPNTLDENELPKLFQLRGEEFADRVKQITTLPPIARLLELARDPNYDAALSQYEALKAREVELRGDLNDTAARPADAVDGLPRGVTPR